MNIRPAALKRGRQGGFVVLSRAFLPFSPFFFLFLPFSSFFLKEKGSEKEFQRETAFRLFSEFEVFQCTKRETPFRLFPVFMPFSVQKSKAKLCAKVLFASFSFKKKKDLKFFWFFSFKKRTTLRTVFSFPVF